MVVIRVQLTPQCVTYSARNYPRRIRHLPMSMRERPPSKLALAAPSNSLHPFRHSILRTSLRHRGVYLHSRLRGAGRHSRDSNHSQSSASTQRLTLPQHVHLRRLLHMPQTLPGISTQRGQGIVGCMVGRVRSISTRTLVRLHRRREGMRRHRANLPVDPGSHPPPPHPTAYQTMDDQPSALCLATPCCVMARPWSIPRDSNARNVGTGHRSSVAFVART